MAIFRLTETPEFCVLPLYMTFYLASPELTPGLWYPSIYDQLISLLIFRKCYFSMEHASIIPFRKQCLNFIAVLNYVSY